MKTISFFTVLLLGLICTACQPSGTPDNEVLIHQNVQLPEGFSDAVEKKYSVQKNIDDTGAVCTFDVTALEKAPSDFVVKNIKVTLKKGSKGIRFKAIMGEQNVNLGTKKAYDTFSTLEIHYYKPGENIKTYTITARGKVSEL